MLPNRPTSKQTAQQRETQRMWRLSAMGSELAFGMIGMVLLGWGIDYLLGSKPKAIIICTIVGVIGSGYNFIRRALVLTRESTKKPGQSEPNSESDDDH